MWQLSHFRKFVALAALVLVVCTVTLFGDEPYEHTTPFVDPLEFDPDFQMFKPFDPDYYGGPPKPRIGWFMNYDRMHIAMSRPETGGTFGLAGQRLVVAFGQDPNSVPLNENLSVPVEQHIDQIADSQDFTYGNRLDIGFMTDENHGWLFSRIKVNNPNLALVNNNFTNGNPQDPMPVAIGTQPTISIYGDVLGAWLGESSTSINSGTFNSLELMKLYRLDRLHNDIVIEPMFGMRYIEFRDIFFAEALTFDTLGDTPILEIDNFGGSAKNQMMTGQIGFRAHGARGRWHLSSEMRVFSGANYQVFERTHRSEVQTGDDAGGGGGGGDGDANIIPAPTTFGGAPVVKRHDEFELTELVIGSELRANASYAIWRDVAINFGFELILVGRGVARGFDFDNDEKLMLVGGTVGFVINR